MTAKGENIKMTSGEVELLELHHELELIRDVLGSLISWMAQSAGNPLSIAECRSLLERLHGH